MKVNYSLLKQLRLENGRSSKDIAEQIGMKPDHYSHIECGRKNMKYKYILTLASIYKKDVNDLLQKEEIVPKHITDYLLQNPKIIAFIENLIKEST